MNHAEKRNPTACRGPISGNPQGRGMNKRYISGEEIFESGICGPGELGQYCCDDELTAWTSIDCTSHYSSGSHYKEIKDSGCHSRSVYPFPFCLEDYYDEFKNESARNNIEQHDEWLNGYPSEMHEAYKKDLSFMFFFVGDLEHVLQKHDERYAQKKEENDEAYRLMEDREGLGPVSKPQKVKTAEPKPRKRATVTISAAALVVGVSESCIKKWERGESTPTGYPGRDDLLALHRFAAKYTSQKAANRTARNMRRASTGYDIDSYGESYETDT